MTRRGALMFAVALAMSIGALGMSSILSTASAQANAPASAASSATNLPPGTAIVAKLVTSLDAHHNKPGDRVEAETTQDVKQNGQVLLRKGSRISGQVTDVVPFSKETRESKLRVVFDKITDKSGEQTSIQLGIFALAGQPDVQPDNIQDPRGLAATQTNAATAGGLKGNEPGAQLTPQSRGIFGIQGMTLTVGAGGLHGTLMSSTNHDVKLSKGTQMVLLTPGQ